MMKKVPPPLSAFQPSRLSALQYPVPDDVGDLADHGHGVLAERLGDVEEDFDGEVVEEEAPGHEQGGGGRDSRAEAVEQFFAAALLQELREACRRLAVKALDVRPFEFEDVDKKESHIRAELTHAVTRGGAEQLDVVRKAP